MNIFFETLVLGHFAGGLYARAVICESLQFVCLFRDSLLRNNVDGRLSKIEIHKKIKYTFGPQINVICAYFRKFTVLLLTLTYYTKTSIDTSIREGNVSSHSLM